MAEWHDEYKFFAESTQFLTERRQAAAQVYLGVNTALIAIAGFLIKDIGVSGSAFLLLTWFIFIIGVTVCGAWIYIINRYKELIKWRYDQLMAMEQAEESSMKGSYQMYTKEYEFISGPGKGKCGFKFSVTERMLPGLFIAVYIVCGIVLTVGWYRGWFRC
jgi:hypothetical protein